MADPFFRPSLLGGLPFGTEIMHNAPSLPAPTDHRSESHSRRYGEGQIRPVVGIQSSLFGRSIEEEFDFPYNEPSYEEWRLEYMMTRYLHEWNLSFLTVSCSNDFFFQSRGSAFELQQPTLHVSPFPRRCVICCSFPDKIISVFLMTTR